MTGFSLWWLALPVVVLPILWHRRKRERTESALLASARFLPVAEPKQRRVWRLQDVLLVLLRCLLLLALIAFLADPVLPWRGDAVLVLPGADAATIQREVRAAGLTDATRMALPDRDAIAWLHAHEREFKPEATLLVVGDVAMPAAPPRFRHGVTLRAGGAVPLPPVEHHVAVSGPRADDWRRLFAAANRAADGAGGPWHIVVDTQPGPRTDLIVWDRPDAPPAALHAPLWWAGDARAFPELADAVLVDGMRVASGARGRVWQSDAWPPRDADAARALLAAWQDLHLGPQPYPMPARTFAADARAPAGPDEGAMRRALAIALVSLFVLERILTHVRRR
jgi:hypothetical protein